jgi:hypothetical protein
MVRRGCNASNRRSSARIIQFAGLRRPAIARMGPPIVQGGDQVTVGDAGGREFVVTVLKILFVIEQLLFEFGDSLTESIDFAGSGEARSWKTCSPRTSDSRALS